MKKFRETELIVNADGSIYHLKLRPEHIADTVFVVGDQGRVPMISKYFDSIEFKIQSREFLTHTGTYRNKRLTVISTGIGTDNIDIVLNELDAAVNIDMQNRMLKEKHTSLNIIRLGTTGALQPEIPVDSMVASAYGLGFDGLMHFYDFDPQLAETNMAEAFSKHVNWNKRLPDPYIFAAADKLLVKMAAELSKGITCTANGFYGPQGRELRIPVAFPGMNSLIEEFVYNDYKITNLEMETSALYGLGKLLGHDTLTICNVIANRVRKEYSKDVKKSVDNMIRYALDMVAA